MQIACKRHKFGKLGVLITERNEGEAIFTTDFSVLSSAKRDHNISLICNSPTLLDGMSSVATKGHEGHYMCGRLRSQFKDESVSRERLWGFSKL